jgi:hypothetical protein
MQNIDKLVIPFFTEYTRQGQSFQAHHNYNKKKNAAWYDWAMFRWRREQRSGHHNRSAYAVDVAYLDTDADAAQYDYAPAKILGFVKVNDAISCIVRPCSTSYAKSSVFTTKWSLAFWDKGKQNPMISLVSVDAIVRHCLMIPAHGKKSVNYHEVYK